MSDNNGDIRQYKFHFRPSDGYVGDCMPFYWKGEYHIFYLKAPLNNECNENLIWSHAKTKDLLNWEMLPDVLPLGIGKDSPDKDGCWSGSVIYKEGKFYIFYTGVNWDLPFQQSVCVAVSTDLIHFNKFSNNPVLIGAGSDPYVFWNKEEKYYWMLLVNNYQEKVKTKAGYIGLAKSLDLIEWKVNPPFYSPYTVLYPEIPEIFEYNNRWYLFYSESADFFASHYRIGDSILGPWEMPYKGDTLDGSDFYAVNTIFDENKRYLLGWVRRKADNTDLGRHLWGGVLGIPRVLNSDGSGNLKVYYPKSYSNMIRNCTPFIPMHVYGRLIKQDNGFILGAGNGNGGSLGTYEVHQEYFYLKFIAIVKSDTPYFGLLFRAKDDLNGYKIMFDGISKNVVASRHGQEIPVGLNPPMELCKRSMIFLNCREIEFEMFVDNDVVEIFVNREIAMSFRAYEIQGRNLAFFVQEGQVEFQNCCFCNI
ncbi:MAG: family 43 glycosylhydrolase [Candidatus Humimicrobiaceae bacterium]